MSENILDKAKAAAQSLKEKSIDFTEHLVDDDKEEIINQFKQKGSEKIVEILEIIEKYKSLFADAGYELNSFNASLTIPPDISISFYFLGMIDETKRKEINAHISESKIAFIILNSLFKASDFAEKIKIGSIKLKTVSIKLGLIPAISISLS
ncbi:MAG: hypothetical protein IPJ23_10330 [Ignavibacteriales bacterium]|nr:hypothetical protein [Ignavibacteriales bacterium]